jgi:hypothetical protein
VTPERWRYQLRRVKEQMARIDSKLAADPASTRAQGWHLRRAALERDRVNYEAALCACDSSIEELK